MDSVRTHAVYQMILVGHRLYVKQSCTDQSVNVPLDGLEILTLSASPVSQVIYTFGHTPYFLVQL